MAEVHKINATYRPLQGVVTFNNNDQKYMVIAANKAASHAKHLREAASLINSSEERPKAVAAWLLEEAGKFERCEVE